MAGQWRAIPIEWALSKDAYHRFLIWVAGSATFSGWGRCAAMQVSFTTREAALFLGVSPSTASAMVQRAKDDGLLLPTGSAQKRKGCGDIYNLGGMLRQSLRYIPDQATDQVPIKFEESADQPNPVVARVFDVEPIKFEKPADQEPINQPNAIRSTPVVHQLLTTNAVIEAEVVPAKKGPKKKEPRVPAWATAYRLEILQAVAEIRAVWPTHKEKQPNGVKFVPDSDYGALAARLEEITAEGWADLSVLVQLAVDHAKAFFEYRGIGAPAAQNFFGKRGFNGGPPPWQDAYRKYVTNRALDDAAHQAALFQELA